MSLKIDSSNEIPFLPQNQDEQAIKKDSAVQIGISSYESKDVGSNWGEEIWRPDGTKKTLHPILGDRWARVQTANASSKDDATYSLPEREIRTPSYDGEGHDRETFSKEPSCKMFDREPHCKTFDKEPYCKVPHDREPPHCKEPCWFDKEPPPIHKEIIYYHSKTPPD